MQNPENPRASAMVGRIRRLLLTPGAEWPAIDAEPMTVGGIYRGWVFRLAAIGPVAGLIGGLLIGHGAFGFGYRPSIGTAVSMALVAYVLTLIGTYVMAWIYDWLAPNFGGTANRISALKLAAFSATAAWLAGIFQLIPALSWLSILGLYSLYLLYVGAPTLMRVPADKALSYTVVAIIAAIILFTVGGFLASRLGAMLAPPGSVATASGKITVPGMGTIDNAKIEAAAKQMEAAGKGEIPAVEPARLQAMLPEDFRGWQRTEVASSGMQAGIGGSRAEARYAHEGHAFELEVIDLAGMGGLAAMAGAMNMQSNRETETGYERMRTIDGRMTTEKWDEQRQRGEYQIVVASRFIVKADGRVPDIDVLKRAVGSIDVRRLEKMAG